jgi:NAD-dependent SIR2 family protein deacetylase
MDQNNRDIVLFLGAGFSHDAGLPTMAEFGDESKKELNNIKGQTKEAEQLLSTIGETFENFQIYCENGTQYIQIDTHNMETVFCIAEALKEANIQNITINNKEFSIKKIIEDIKL